MSQDELDTPTGIPEVVDLDEPEPRWPRSPRLSQWRSLYGITRCAYAGSSLVVPVRGSGSPGADRLSHHAGKHRLDPNFGFAVDAVLGLIISVILLDRRATTHKEGEHWNSCSRPLRFPALNILVFALWYWRLDAGGPHPAR